MLNPTQNQALYPVLQHYTGCKILSISSEGEDLSFKTYMGDGGILKKDRRGNWIIKIGDEIIYKIEKDVFNVLIKPSKKNSLEDYIEILNELYNSSRISYRSKLLVMNILKFLEEYIIGSDFLPKSNIRVGIFMVFNICGTKIINCLN